MSRSIWKQPPSWSPRLSQRHGLRSYERRNVLGLEVLHARLAVHNGLRWIPLTVTEHHLGYKFGQFSATKRRVVHKKSRGGRSLRRD
jgi:ribosomal protein S19